jgi:L-lactate dehydrogenase (cytochrome)/(S)-mandelate dehydrogenase
MSASVLSVEDMRLRARRTLPRSVFDFVDGGAEDELTVAGNRAGFERIRFVPRVLNDVSHPELSCDLLGTPASAPIVIAPMGSCTLAWPDADIAIAKAAAAHGIPYTLSTMSTTSIERMAQAVQGPLWFQLYVLNDHAFNHALLARAEACGYRTLVVTLDLQAGGKRERDLRNGISIPLRLRPRQLLEGLAHPRWALRMIRGGWPQFENVRGLMADGRAGLTIAARVGQSLDAAFDWNGFGRLRERWRGKLIVKGVVHPEDARRLVELGADGLWVSNHGGRQLDGAIASIDALPAVAAAVQGRVPLLIDSGVRRGADILKARARGATAVAIGRPALFGAAVAGERGVRRVLEILTEELELCMKLSGTPTLQEAGPCLLA